jgi:hypothetical protein
MMGQFVVVEPGQEAGAPEGTHDHDEDAPAGSAVVTTGR